MKLLLGNCLGQMNDNEAIIYSMVKQLETLKLENESLKKKLTKAIEQRNAELQAHSRSNERPGYAYSWSDTELKYNLEIESISDLI